MGRFLGQPNIGPKFFGPTPVPVGCAQLAIQAAAGNFAGFSSNIDAGWNGFNGVASFFGSIVSGEAQVWPHGADLGFGDGLIAGVPLAAPYFSVVSGGVLGQFFFGSVTINGHTYLTTDPGVVFDNGAGCGPTRWSWAAPAGLVPGATYCSIWVASS